MNKRKMNETLEELVRTDPNSFYEPELFFERLARALRSCQRYIITLPLTEKYVESRIDPETKRLLEEAIREKDINKLKAISYTQLYENLKKTIATLEPNHMEVRLFVAQELEYNNQYIEYFQSMFQILAKDTYKFVQEQWAFLVYKMDNFKSMDCSFAVPSMYSKPFSLTVSCVLWALLSLSTATCQMHQLKVCYVGQLFPIKKVIFT
ncbi:hypothetical protein RFI_37016 [Reticulomyxa filosa]|uniref:Uncharacterized protein n=1 Tax=Reticulomyxa filosa TaxID=46433 RepID=X6LEN2_RETFI|nr:hypothetical protein RFI_37016 [Reticulomyxa filosa]|eukprot:ETO00428.1 hypothetical protein RFI_37016 [Reticulomyxa filosa]